LETVLIISQAASATPVVGGAPATKEQSQAAPAVEFRAACAGAFDWRVRIVPSHERAHLHGAGALLTDAGSERRATSRAVQPWMAHPFSQHLH
jgi:hypothetical protein